MGDFGSMMVTLSTWALPVVLAITLHEAAHGYVANMFGDDTAKRLGRVSFNPIRHIDPFGTIIMPLMLFFMKSPFMFGYAKPVPVDFSRLRNPRTDMIWVALAGPGINFVIALVAALLIHATLWVPGLAQKWFLINLLNTIQFNLLIAVFNMLPIPPLDGGRVLVGILPDRLARPIANLEPYGMFILLGLLLVLPVVGSLIGINVSLFSWVVLPPVEFLYNFILDHVVGFAR
ncbi:site-2 protease family protein [Govanella unica]|uniref:Site-2 protease family protein n=1 Tax=Govanella unica TaxID=2975056 RepID=A0A9X3TX62_9PROT|nr:site-2 protease family protein [Govania unica]MDA5193317.1 site-2 protease family protein [Govania unica]